MGKYLSLGVSRRSITPKLGTRLYGYNSQPVSDFINDDLTTTAYYFTYNETKFLIIVSTICSIATDKANELRKSLSSKFDIPFNNILLSVTHTHTGPNFGDSDEGSEWGNFDYDNFNNIFLPAVFSAVEEAIKNKEPVLMATAQGLSNVGINRREVGVDNIIRLGESEWGVYNPKMTIFSFKGEQGIVGTLISYGAHGTSMGPNTHISRDWSGGMTDAVEEYIGGICDLLLGPQGDVAPRKVSPYMEASDRACDAIKKNAAEDAIRIYKTISEYKDTFLEVFAGKVTIPVLPRLPYNTLCEMIENADVENMRLMAKVEHQFNIKVKESYENNYEEIKSITCDQTIFRLGEFIFVAYPYELFSEIGLRVNKEIENHEVISIAVANGYEGYFPTQKELCMGGYEIIQFRCKNIQRYVDNADFHLLKETINNIESFIN